MIQKTDDAINLESIERFGVPSTSCRRNQIFFKTFSKLQIFPLAFRKLHKTSRNSETKFKKL